MLLEEIRNIKSEKKDLRDFGIIFGIVSGILGGLLWWKGKDTYSIFAVLSIVFFFFAFVLPAILKPLQKTWMTLAVVVAFFMTKVILGLLYYLVFTSIGLGSRLCGKKFLDVKIDNSKKSYWICRTARPFDKKYYEKQF